MRTVLILLPTALLAAASPGPQPADPGIVTSPLGHFRPARPGGPLPPVPGEVIVKLKDGLDAERQDGAGIAGLAHRPALAGLLQRYGVTRGHKLFPRVRSRRLDQVLKLAVGDAGRVGALAAELERRPEVEYAHPNAILKAEWIPNDTYYATTGAWGQSIRDLWGLQKIQVETAWDRARGAGVTVAVLDTGIDATHPDLAPQVWQNAGETGLDGAGRDKRSNGADDDGNGFVDDWRGWDFITNDNAPTDLHGHGTHVAGTIAAVADNAQGIAGVAPLARVMAVKVLGDGGSGTVAQIAAGVLYAADNGAQVMNASLAGAGTTPQILVDALAHAHDVRGAVFVAAAANSNTDVGTAAAGSYPANIRDVVAVAAFNSADQKAWFSNYGAKIDVAAPGGGDSGTGYAPDRSILSLKSALAGSAMTDNGRLLVGTQYVRQMGTSMACPHVAGVAALLRSLHPTWSAEQVRQALRRGADDVSDVGFDVWSGYGRLNASRALDLPAPLAAQLTGPAAGFASSVPVNVTGTAAGPGFVSWTLEHGVGSMPSGWTVLASSSSPITEGVLFTWNPTGLAEGAHTLRLTARNTSGDAFEDRMGVTVDSVVIQSPLAGGPPHRPGDVVTLSGTVAPSGFSSYRFEISGVLRGPVPNPNVTLTNGGLQPIVDGVLGSWDPSGLPADHYRICVVAIYNGSNTVQECTHVLVDPTLHPGWPKNIGLFHDGFGTLSIVDHLTAADLDGDGDKELLVVYNQDVRVYTHDGEMLPGWPRTINPLARWDTAGQFGPAVGDLTGDGKPEVVARNNIGDVFVWSAAGVALPGWPRNLASSYGSVLVDDLDGDGLAEIVTVDSTVRVFDRNGATRPPSGIYTGLTGRIAIGDLDDDGAKEIVVARAGELTVVRGDGTVMPGWPRSLSFGFYCPIPALGDLDADGKREIVVGTGDGHVFAFRQDGTTLPGWPRFTKPIVVNSAAIGDIDGDGRPEVVAGVDDLRVNGRVENYLFAWRGDGTSLESWPVRYDGAFHAFFGFGAPVIADVDGDSVAEVIVSSDGQWPHPLPLHAYKATGAEAVGFPKPTWSIGAHPYSAAAVGDLDGDGSQELAWLDLDGWLAVWDLSSAHTSPAPWPMFAHDAGHTSRHGSDPVRLRVSLRTNGGGRGTVNVTPAGGSCDNLAGAFDRTCTFTYATATEVTLSAQPAGRSTFLGWGGACTGTGNCTIRVESLRAVTATFALVNQPPTVSAGGPYSGTNAAPITMTATGSDADGDPLLYRWTFGDGTEADGRVVSHHYLTSDSYQVSVRAFDGYVWSLPSYTTAYVANAPLPVVWTNVVGVAAATGTLTRGSEPAGWTAGAVSKKEALAGSAAVSFVAPDTTSYRLLGLSHGDSSQSYDDIDYALYPAGNGVVYVFEGGVNRGAVGTYQPGDFFSVELEPYLVRYRRNNTILYTNSSPDVRYPIRVDTALYTPGATLANVTIYGSLTGTNVAPDAVLPGTYRWTAGQEIPFDGSSSTDPDGTIKTYSWSFGDGTTGSGATVRHSYASPGTYTAVLTVFDDQNVTDAASATVVVTPKVPAPFVQWTSAVGVETSAGTLRKVTADGWTAGAVSTGTLVGDGYAETVVAETNTYRLFGLGTGDSGAGYDDVDFGLYPAANGQLYVFEKGVYRGSFGDYAPGDVLRVSVDGGVVRYIRNGRVLYESTQPPVYPLLVDTALYSAGATLQSVRGGGMPGTPPVADAGGPYEWSAGEAIHFDGSASRDVDGDIVEWRWDFGDGSSATGSKVTHGYAGGGAYTAILTVTDSGGASHSASAAVHVDTRTWTEVTWANREGVAVVDTHITKTAPDGWGNGGAVSVNAVTSGNLHMQCSLTETATYRLIGLGNVDFSRSYEDVDFAIYPAADAHLYVFENGAYKGRFGSYVSGDRVRVSVRGGVVRYVHNGRVLYTSAVAPSYPLGVDTAFYTSGASLRDAILAAGP